MPKPDTALLLYAAQAMQLHREHSTRSALASALVSSQPILHFLRLPPSRVHGVAFTPDSRQIVAVAGDTGLWLFDVKGGTLVGQRAVPPVSCPSCTSTELYAVAVSPDGQTIAATGQAGQILMWQTVQIANAEQPRTGSADRARAHCTASTLVRTVGCWRLGAAMGPWCEWTWGAGLPRLCRATWLGADSLGSGVSTGTWGPRGGRRRQWLQPSILESSPGRKVLGPLFVGMAT